MDSPRIGVFGWFLRAFAAGFGVVFGVGSALSVGVVFYLLLAAAGTMMLSTNQTINLDMSGNSNTRSLDSLTKLTPGNSYSLTPSPVAPAEWQDPSATSYPSANPYPGNSPSHPVAVAPYNPEPATASPYPASPALAPPESAFPEPSATENEGEQAPSLQPSEPEPSVTGEEGETSDTPSEEERSEPTVPEPSAL